MLLMLSATFTGIIITSFESALAACVVLTSFIPMLSGTGGNSGSQSSVAVIRALSLDEIDFSDLVAVVWKEIRVAVLCGVCLAAANFVKMMVVDRWLMHNPEVTPLVALVVCLTLVFTVLCAKVVGCTPAHGGGEAGHRPGGDGLPLHHHHCGRTLPADLFLLRHLDPAPVSALPAGLLTGGEFFISGKGN